MPTEFVKESQLWGPLFALAVVGTLLLVAATLQVALQLAIRRRSRTAPQALDSEILQAIKGPAVLFVALLGVFLVIPIGGADMPVVVALLNSYSGLAASAAGFVIGNMVLIIAGALVGASGLILTQLMCKGMNRSFFSVILGGFGGGAIDAMIVMEEFGKGLVVEPFVPTVVCAGGFLAQAGTDAQREEHLSAIIDGSRVFAFAYAEPRGRYDYADLETTAKKDGDGYVLNGHKAVVIGAPWASHLVVTARTGGERRDM